MNSLKKTNARLEDRCESLEQFVDVLKKNWKYSAPSIPSSYWFEQGHGEMYVTSMNTFLKDIKEMTTMTRSGEWTDDFRGEEMFLGGNMVNLKGSSPNWIDNDTVVYRCHTGGSLLTLYNFMTF